jgi:hypothetical protein
MKNSGIAVSSVWADFAFWLQEKLENHAAKIRRVFRLDKEYNFND